MQTVQYTRGRFLRKSWGCLLHGVLGYKLAYVTICGVRKCLPSINTQHKAQGPKDSAVKGREAFCDDVALHALHCIAKLAGRGVGWRGNLLADLQKRWRLWEPF
jgi:hypothetical protein